MSHWLGALTQYHRCRDLKPDNAVTYKVDRQLKRPRIEYRMGKLEFNLCCDIQVSVHPLSCLLLVTEAKLLMT